MLDIKTIHYQNLIIKALSFGRSLPANDISLKIEKSLPLINRILSAMVKKGILQEDGLALSTGGRRPVTYSISPKKIYVVSVAMDQHITKISLIDLSNMDILNQEKYDLPLEDNNDSLPELTTLIEGYLNKDLVNKEKILGVGIGMPGFVDVKNGFNYSFFRTAYKKQISISEFIEKKIDLPVFIDNDSSVIALTEQTMGPAHGKKNALVINFGWGVGLGMILDGQLFRGNNGFAGEFSHIPLFNNNKLCKCGKSGCLETEASMLTVIMDMREAIHGGRASVVKCLSEDLEIASSQVIEAALAGDQLAVELFTQASYDIGRGIAILIHILNPEQIIISGRGAAAGSLILAPVYQAINKFCIPSLASYTQVIISDLSKNSEVYGAAALVTENLVHKQFADHYKYQVTKM